MFVVQRDRLDGFVRERLAQQRLLDSKTASVLLGLGVEVGE